MVAIAQGRSGHPYDWLLAISGFTYLLASRSSAGSAELPDEVAVIDAGGIGDVQVNRGETGAVDLAGGAAVGDEVGAGRIGPQDLAGGAAAGHVGRGHQHGDEPPGPRAEFSELGDIEPGPRGGHDL